MTWFPAVVAAALPGLPAAAALRRAPLRGLRPELGDWGFDLAAMDRARSPGDGFYFYANGKYLQDLEIPADETSWGSFKVLSMKTLRQVRGILEEEQRKGSKLAAFYTSFMDENAAEERGAEPARPGLQAISEVATKRDFARAAGLGQSGFTPSPLGMNIGEDQKDPTRRCIFVDQAGLGLPEREYYLEDSFKSVRDAYAAHLSTMLGMFSWPFPCLASAAILDFETKIAKVSWPAEDMRDSIKTYNPMTYKDLLEKFPGFAWKEFFEAAGLPAPEGKIVVGAVSAVEGIARLIKETDIHVLKSWMAAHYIRDVAPMLSKAFVDAIFAFGKVLTGQEEITPRWQRGIDFTSNNMGDELGQRYVEKHFPPESKAKVEALCAELKRAFRERLKKLAWMTEGTRQKASEKLEAQAVAIGYPPRWRDYSGLRADPSDLFGNAKRSAEFYWNHQLSRLSKPVDPEMWAGLQPHMVNAFNMPHLNRIIFPAAILQAPFFDAGADMAVNFGGIGAVIGHEMMHSFDDEGRNYNKTGKLEDWWTEEDSKEFDTRAKSFMDQFARFDLDALGGKKGLKMNPELMEGEALADLGGLTLAVDAYQAAQKGELSPPFVGEDPDDGYEGLRRLFLGYAQVWRGKTRPASLQNQVTTDPHPPAMARVDIPTRNIAAWYKAFNVPVPASGPGSDSERVEIW